MLQMDHAAVCSDCKHTQPTDIYQSGGTHSANLLTQHTIHCTYEAGMLVLTFREVKVSQEVRLLSTGCASGLQLESGCSERTNPLGFVGFWVFRVHTDTHTSAYIYIHMSLHPDMNPVMKSCYQTQRKTKVFRMHFLSTKYLALPSNSVEMFPSEPKWRTDPAGIFL